MKSDVIVVHPRDMFYPLWIAQLNRDRHLFGKIIIMMSQSASDRDYTNEIKLFLKGDVIVKSYHDDGKDWRNAAVNEALIHAQSDSILFLEQDFLAVTGFFETLIEYGKEYGMVGFREGEGRFHPACLLVQSSLIAETRKDFSVEPDISDHFAKFTKDMEGITTALDIQKVTMPLWHHLAGLTQNHRLTENFYNSEQFLTYLKRSLAFPQPPEWAVFTQVKIYEVMQSGAKGEDPIINLLFDEYEL